MTDATKPAGDLVQRLRQTFPDIPYHRDQLHIDAADEIDRLTAALADRERAIAEAVADQHVEAVVRSVQPHLDVRCKAWRELSEHCRYWLEAERAIRSRSGAKG